MKRWNRRGASAGWMAAAAGTAASAAVLMYAGAAADAVREGLRLCAESVIPSLFPMLVLSQYLVRSGGAGEIGTLLEKPVRFWLGLPGVCGAALLTAMIGGYPAGARAAATLTESGQISRREGERLADLAFCSGPGFTVGWVGAQLYQNKSVGLMILTAQIFSCIIIGTILRCVSREPQNVSQSTVGCGRPSQAPAADAFVTSVSDAASTVLTMCAFIVCFQVIGALQRETGLNETASRFFARLGLGELAPLLLPCFTEVTVGSLLSVRSGLPFTAFVVGFGGLSVHFQNFAVCRAIRPRKSVYLVCRLTQGCLCALLTAAALRLPWMSRVCAPVSAGIPADIPAAFSPVSGSFGVLLLVMCLMSVICLPDGRLAGSEKRRKV